MKATVRSKVFVGVTFTIAGFAVAGDTPLFLSRDGLMRVSPQFTCGDCGPGAAWMTGCPAGDDRLDTSGAEIGIYMAGDPTCSSPTPANFVLRGSVTVSREASTGTQIDTEITEMELSGNGATLVVGPGAGNAIKEQTLGTIVERVGDDTLADSEFNVFFEADLVGFGKVWNHEPLLITAELTCVPPDAEYTHPEGQCVALYDDPNVGEGVIVAYLGRAIHDSFIPTLSEWTAIGMTLLLLVAGTIVFLRKRRAVTSVA